MGRLIVHWSPLHGQARTTASMCAVALGMHSITGGKICLTSTQYNMSDLEGMFDNRQSAERKQLLYKAAGLNALVTNIKRTALSSEDVEDCAMSTLVPDIDLFPGIEFSKGISNTNETDELVYQIITNYIKPCYDWTFVDLAAGGGTQSMRFVQAADVVVVTLSQNKAVWDSYCREYPSILNKENVFYLLGGAKPDSVCSVHNLARTLQKKTGKTCTVGMILDNVGYMDAVSEGSVPSFFMLNSKVARREENEDFIRESLRTAGVLRDFTYSGRSSRKRGKVR